MNPKLKPPVDFIPVRAEAVLFDLDGTLADVSHRRHFVSNGRNDWVRFFESMDEDSLNTTVYDQLLMNKHFGKQIVIVTGRPSDYMKKTLDWLKYHRVPIDDLYMRTQGDYRGDDIIKKEIYHDVISKRYIVKSVFDDRQKVVDMWRSIGLTCFQVAPGDF